MEVRHKLVLRSSSGGKQEGFTCRKENQWLGKEAMLQQAASTSAGVSSAGRLHPASFAGA